MNRSASFTQAYDFSALFAPDVMLAVQLQSPPKLPCEPEHRLMFAVLEHAIEDIQKHARWRSTQAPNAPAGRSRYQEAADWITSADTDWLFSFTNICAQLGLDADWIRNGLRQGGWLHED